LATLDLNGTQLAYEERGTGLPTFLFIPGGACDHTAWQPQFDDLSRDHRCVTFDRRGTGGSAATPPFTLAQEVDDAAALAAALGIERVIAVGHSLGGLTALLLNERLAETVVGVVTGDTPLSPNGVHPGEAAALVRSAPDTSVLVERFTSPTTSPEAIAAIRATLGTASPGPAADFIESCEVDGVRVQELVREADRKPFMALWPAGPGGEGPRAGDPPWLRDIAMFIRQEPVADSGHFFQLEQPAITNALLRAFLDDVERDPRLPPR
jgi:pimeloyl-ACP methyl ester carboxylesterase